jgi:hypothetical protein
MHLELVVPGLLPAGEAFVDALRARRFRALERLAARGRRASHEVRTLEEWLADAFELEGELPAGALTRAADAGAAPEGFWMRADPVHLRLGRDRMSLLPAAAFPLSREEADALVAALNAHFGDSMTFHAARADAWAARMSAGESGARPPLELAGADVDSSLPGGEEAPRLHALMNEVQMLLHAHPVNEAREARGEPAVNSVWFWGGGTLPQTAETRWRSLTGTAPVLHGLARITRIPMRAPTPSAGDWLAAAPEDGRHLVLVDSLRVAAALDDAEGWLAALAQLEARWFAPLEAALRAARIGMLTVHVPDARAGLSFETTKGDLRRFWRRSRPLASYR